MIDVGHKETDALLDEMERKVKREYLRAVQDTELKLTEYFANYQRKDNVWRQWVADGTKTEKEWRDWRKGQMLIGDRWKEMQKTLAEDYHNANVIARSVVNGYMPEAYAINHNYATFLVEKGAKVDTSYTLYDRQTVERIMRDEPDILPPPGTRMKQRIAEGKDIAWQQGQIQSVTMQSIMQGESVGGMAHRIAEEMGSSNWASTLRYARTAITGAESAGRQAGYERAQKMGIKLKKMWLATLDGRTRHEHRMLDGQTVPVDQPFTVDGYEIMSPGDPTAEAFLIWNCRCRTIAQIEGFERDPADLGLRYDEKLGDMSYEEWKHAKEKPQEPIAQPSQSTLGGIRGISDEHKKGMEEILAQSTHPEVQAVFARYADQLECIDSNYTGGACFRNSRQGTFFNETRVAAGDACHAPYQTSFHEFGHMIDWLAGGKDSWEYKSQEEYDGRRLLDVMKSDFRAFKKSLGVSKAEDVISVLRNEHMPLRTCGSISDALEKMTGKSYPLGVGHGIKYHKREGQTEREFFAEVLDGAAANEESYQQMRRIFPNAVDMVWKMLGGAT